MPNAPTIELPRLENESPRAYQARVEYIVAGPVRDLRTVARKLNKSLTIVGRWSGQYEWVKQAQAYDQMVGNLAAQEAADAYRADLAAHRKRAMDSSKNLMTLAIRMAVMMDEAMQQPRTIKGADGNTYKLHGIEITSSTLTTLSKAITTALDLEAHALGIDQLLPALETDDSE